jgi:DNA-binding MarR family transcriptional regulator
VPGKIQAEIRQSRPFSSLEEEAFLNIHRTADLLDQRLTELLRPHGLTGRQYNVLRILRGAGECGASCKEIGARMVTTDPDVTRLVDRMQARGLVTRTRSIHDRRVVSIRIAVPGLDLLASLDKPVNDLALSAMGALRQEELSGLIHYLERLRGTDS